MSVLFYVRVIVGTYAQLTWVNGMWGLLEGFAFHNTWYRNVLLLLGGMVLCRLAGTLITNTCVVPSEFIIYHLPNDDDTRACWLL
jgi:hypothetical protein